jgi:hypothetical protein
VWEIDEKSGFEFFKFKEVSKINSYKSWINFIILNLLIFIVFANSMNYQKLILINIGLILFHWVFLDLFIDFANLMNCLN